MRSLLMSARRTVRTARFGLLVGTLGMAVAASGAQHGRSITGAAPIGATGPAPTGATGRAPVGSTGSLIQPSPLHTAPGGSGFHGGYLGGYGRYGNAYIGTSRLPNRTPNQYRGHEYGRHEHGYGVVAPFFYGVGYLPDDSVAYDESESPSPYAEAPPPDTPTDPLTQHYEIQEDILAGEVQRLNSELQELRAQNTRAYPPPADYTGSENSEATPPAPAVIVVLRDGKQFKSNDYAVMNDTFWDFSKSPARRVPMSQVDVPASVQASSANGAQFPD